MRALRLQNEVSTEEQGPDGTLLPSADWDGLDDQTEDTNLYESRLPVSSKCLRFLNRSMTVK